MDKTEKMFDPDEMQRRVDRLIAEGRMPTLDQLMDVLDDIRPEYQREIKAIRQTGSRSSPRPGRKQN
jgi:hypothetical protein